MPVEFRFKDLYYDKMKKEKRRITLQEVAAAAGVSKQAVANWLDPEKDPISVQFVILDKLCDYFECSLDQLVVRSQDRENLPILEG